MYIEKISYLKGQVNSQTREVGAHCKKNAPSAGKNGKSWRNFDDIASNVGK